MLSCREVSRLIASDELVDLGWLERILVRLHLVRCHHCRRYAVQLRAISTAALERQSFGPADLQALERLERSILERCIDRSVMNTQDAHGRDPEPPATQSTDPD